MTEQSKEEEVQPAPQAEPVAEAAPQEIPSLQAQIGDESYSAIKDKGWKTAEDVVNGYTALEKWKGNAISIPTEDSSPEAVEDFYKKIDTVPELVRIGDDKTAAYRKLGMPEKPEDYVIDLPDSLAHIDQDTIDIVTKQAHAMKFTQNQINEYIALQADLQQDAVNKVYVSEEEATAQLKKVWGDDFDNRLKGATLAAEYAKDKHPDSFKNLLAGPYRNDPFLLELLGVYGKTMSESDSPLARQAINYGTSPEEAKLKIKDIEADAGKMQAYMDSNNPAHKKVLEDMTLFHKQAYPGTE